MAWTHGYSKSSIRRSSSRGQFQTTFSADAVHMKATSTLKVNRQVMDFIDMNAGIVEYAWAANDTDTTGEYNAEVEIDWGGSPTEYQTFPSKGYFAISISDDLA